MTTRGSEATPAAETRNWRLWLSGRSSYNFIMGELRLRCNQKLPLSFIMHVSQSMKSSLTRFAGCVSLYEKSTWQYPLPYLFIQFKQCNHDKVIPAKIYEWVHVSSRSTGRGIGVLVLVTESNTPHDRSYYYGGPEGTSHIANIFANICDVANIFANIFANICDVANIISYFVAHFVA